MFPLSTASCLPIPSKAALTSFKRRDAPCGGTKGRNTATSLFRSLCRRRWILKNSLRQQHSSKLHRHITALSTQDERIADEFRAIEQGRVSSGKIVEIEGDIPVGMKMKLGDFAEAISTRVWESVGRANWRTFEEARAFVHSLGLKSVPEWWVYCKSGKKPADIPANPQ